MRRYAWLAVVGFALAVGLVVAPAHGAVAQPVGPEQVGEPCPEPVDPIELTSVGQVEGLLEGTWIQCSGEKLFRSSGGNEVGIQFTSDGRFSRLYDDDGVLVRAEGLEQQGTWTVIDTTEMNDQSPYQTDVTLLGLGTQVLFPEFYESPSLLRLPSPFLATEPSFVPWTGDPPISAIPSGVGEGPCGQPTGPVELRSVAQVEELLAGPWVLCGTESALGPIRPSEVGIEFFADGRFALLFDDGAGGLVRGGVDAEGTWEVIDTTEMNGPGFYQVNLTIGGGTRMGFATFLEQPEHLRYDARGSDYQRPTSEPRDPADVPPTSPDADELPATGRSAETVVVGLILALAGSALLVTTRRWRGATGPSD